VRALRWVFAAIAVVLFVAATYFFASILVDGDHVIAQMMVCSPLAWIFAGLAFWGFYLERQARQSRSSST
jgi:hypothetical protein